MSKRKKILAVARGIGPAKLQELCLAAWRLHKRDFGLPGFEAEHPDYHRFLAVVHGQRGMIRAGDLVDAGGGKYAAGESRSGKPSSPIESSRRDLLRMEHSSAARKHRSGEQVSFAAACNFWNIRPINSDASDVYCRRRMEVLSRMLADRSSGLLACLGEVHDALLKQWRHRLLFMEGSACATSEDSQPSAGR